MTLDELKAALLNADNAAVLVSRRLICRVIQQVHRLPSQFGNIPHRRSCIIDRHVLFHHIEQAELNLESDRLLPTTVILLSQPSLEQLQQWGHEGTLLQYWQRLFHANVHLVLEQLVDAGRLTAADVQSRLEQVGRIECNEIQDVLKQEDLLFPGGSSTEFYIEFVAIYLELKYFLPNLLPVYFPAIRDFARIDALLAADVDAEALFLKTRLNGAPNPVVQTDNSSDQPNESYWKLIRQAEKLVESGNAVRAAILRTRAAGIAPSALTLSTRTRAVADLLQLATRLQAALKLSDAEMQDWQKALPPLLEKADHSHWSPEARLLYDLQKVCVDNERDLFALDLVEWVASVGKRPIKRPMPSQRVVRIAKHLGSAAQRLPTARVSDGDRRLLGQLLQNAQQQSAERLRSRFRPVLNDAFYDVGFHARNAPEQTAFAKMIEELLDRITKYGFVTFSDLRDAISRNNLKLPDIADPQEFILGDPLLRLDRRLAASLDGVYRPSEIYLRLLQRGTSLNFGTKTGRTFTRFVSVPYGGALFLLEMINLLVYEFHKFFGGEQTIHIGPLTSVVSWMFPRADVGEQASRIGQAIGLVDQFPLGDVSLVRSFAAAAPKSMPFPFLGLVTFLLLGTALLCVFHVEPVRRWLKRSARIAYRVGRRYLVELPAELLPIETLRLVWKTWSFQLFYWYLFKPLVACLLIFFWAPDAFNNKVAALAIFLAVSFFLTSRMSQAAGQIVVQAIAQVYDWLRSDLFHNLFQWIVRVFKRVTDTVEYVLYTVDEWLRFRSGDTALSMLARAVLGLVWFPVSYLARIYMLVLIEPMLNPIKLPAAMIGAKLLLPFQPALILFGTKLLTPLFGAVLAGLVAFVNVWLLPDLFGFLFWEVRENWSLYRANRRKNLAPVSIGHHGETMVQLLRPGFHSGTLPKLFANLRWAERNAQQNGAWRSVRTYRHALMEAMEGIRLFVERELVALVHLHESWRSKPLSVGELYLASNRIAVQLRHAAHPKDPVSLTFELQSGWLVACLASRGWLRELSPEQFASLRLAITGLYKIASVDLSREQIEGQLPAGVKLVEIADGGLVLSLAQSDGSRVVYAVREEHGHLRPRKPKEAESEWVPILDSLRLIFMRTPLSWHHWVESWNPQGFRLEEDPLFPSLLGPPPSGPQPSGRTPALGAPNNGELRPAEEPGEKVRVDVGR